MYKPTGILFIIWSPDNKAYLLYVFVVTPVAGRYSVSKYLTPRQILRDWELPPGRCRLNFRTYPTFSSFLKERILDQCT